MVKCHCGKSASFNVFGEKARFCVEHKEPHMINVKNKTCELCEKIPTFNVRGETKRRFCAEHKEPHMVNLASKLCEFDGCEKLPSYNIRGKTKGRFCAKHKEPDMVDVKNKTCETDGCDKQPTYNIRGETKARLCADHKESNMINVKDKTCELCEKIPTFNVCGETKARFCADHKEANMIDVVSKTCETDGCDKQPTYCFLSKIPTHCAVHKQKGMITSPKRKCETTCCKELGTHEANGMRFCEDHMPNGAENLGVDTCKSCGLDDILTNGKCGTCDPQVIHTRRHAKENRVADVFRANGLEKFVHNKILESKKCGMERPDFQIDCGTHFVYIEVDEHQHSSYACECEQTRMINLVEQRGIPVRWIRYNPDSYEPVKGQRPVKLEQREKKLVEYVKWAMIHPPQEEGNFSDVLYLFYNEYDTKERLWNTLIKMI